MNGTVVETLLKGNNIVNRSSMISSWKMRDMAT